MAEEDSGKARKPAAPLFRRARKAGMDSQALRRKSQRRYAKRLQRDRELAQGIVRLRPIELRFVAELVRNGGNAGAAAEAIGLKRSTGRTWIHRPEIVTAYRQHMETLNEGDLSDWREVAIRAKRTLEALLDSPDDRVRKDAAIYITNRQLGAIPAKVENRIIQEEAMPEWQLAAALSLVASRGLTFEAAKLYVRDHADEALQWYIGQQRANALPATTEISAPTALGVSRTNDLALQVGEEGVGGDRAAQGDSVRSEATE